MKPETRKKRLMKLRGEYAAIQKHLKAKDAEIAKLRRECQHEYYHRQADPSGGHDHAYTCNICGKEW